MCVGQNCGLTRNAFSVLILSSALSFASAVSRIALVKPQKSRAITDLLVRMAQSGQLRQRVTEDQLIGLLDQVDQSQGGDGEPKITVSRIPACARH